MGKKKETMPWEDYAAEAEQLEAAPVEEASPWDDYQANMAQQQELERTLPDTAGKAATLALQGASHDFMDEIAGGVNQFTGGDYTEGRDKYRDKVDAAREDLGFAGDAIETAGNVASTLAFPAARSGKVATELALAAAQGVGSADEMEDVPKSVGMSTLAAGATQALGKGAAKVFGYDDPARKLAKVGGARGMDFFKKGVEGVKETRRAPELVAKKLDGMGFFKQGTVEFDLNQHKFIPDKTKGRLDNFFTPQSLDDLHNRAMSAVSKLKDENQRLLKGKAVPMDKLADTLRAAVNDYIPDGYNYAARQNQAENIVGTILNDLQMQGKIKRSPLPSGFNKPVAKGTTVSGNNMFLDAADVEKIKKQLYDEVKQTFGQSKTANDLSLGPEAQRKFSAKIDQLMDKIGGENYKRNNDTMSALLTQTETIFNKISREAGYGVEGPRLTMGSQFINGVKDMTVNNVPIGVGMARMGQLPESAGGQAVRNYVERFPVEAINNNKGRSPQSVPNIPEQFIRTPLPRTTKEMLENKNFVLGKVAQMAPEMFEGIKDVFDHDPERLSEIAPVLAQKMPHLFTRDKYNRFDGRIVTEKDKAAAIKDTLSNTSLNSIQQSAIITKLNKEGLYDG